jgi:hypothetical protein
VIEVGGLGEVTRLIGNPIRLSATPASYWMPPPKRPTHTTIQWMPEEKS